MRSNNLQIAQSLDRAKQDSSDNGASSESKYDYNLTLSLLSDGSEFMNDRAEIIYLKFDDKNTLHELSADDKSKLQKLTGKSRLYIVGHGAKSCVALYNEKNQYINSLNLAELIANNVNKDNVAGLRIRLFSCYAAGSTNKNYDDSFAAQLHVFLCKNGISDIDLLANTGIAGKNSMLKCSLGMVEESLINHSTYKKILATAETINKQLQYLASQCVNFDEQAKRSILMTCFILKCSYQAMIERAAAVLAQQIKRVNRLIPFTKVLYAWDGNEQIIVDSYKEKTWAKQSKDKLANAGHKTIADGLEQSRSYQSKLSFLRNAKLSYTDCTVIDDIIGDTTDFTKH